MPLSQQDTLEVDGDSEYMLDGKHSVNPVL